MYYVIKNNVCYMAADSSKNLEGYGDVISDSSIDLKDYRDNPNKYIVESGRLVLNHNYEAELIQKEKERVAMLKMTPRDFILAITSMGIEWADIKALMSQNPQVEIELNYCQYVYRGNPLLDELCGNFGVTSEQLDELFKSTETR